MVVKAPECGLRRVQEFLDSLIIKDNLEKRDVLFVPRCDMNVKLKDRFL